MARLGTDAAVRTGSLPASESNEQIRIKITNASAQLDSVNAELVTAKSQ